MCMKLIFFNYDNFLFDAIYNWLKEPEEILIACADLEKEKKNKTNQNKTKMLCIHHLPGVREITSYKSNHHSRVVDEILGVVAKEQCMIH